MTTVSTIVTADSKKDGGIGHVRLEWPVTIRWNERSRSFGIGGHVGVEYARGLQRIKIGSSPRARGTRHTFAGWHGMQWFIPAGAGNTLRNTCGTIASTVHPRGRGEHIDTTEQGNGNDGSSPRARGTRRSRHEHQLQQRFIPAGAGNTPADRDAGQPHAVHPRGRGEHLGSRDPQPKLYGSSPRARGTLLLLSFLNIAARFIPAGAGNTACASPICADWTVHPRGRGEHASSAASATACIGSSPRARGTPCHSEEWLWLSRFIPAGAGNTVLRGRAGGCRAVHPRGRGEH